MNQVIARSGSAFAPNWALHPGEHLEEYLETLGWSQAELARLVGVTPKLVSEIINGKNPVTPETAIRLERVLGLKAEIWLGLQSNWDLQAARCKEVSLAKERKAWLSKFPVKELAARGDLPKSGEGADVLGGLLKLLAIGAPESFETKLSCLAVHHRQSKSESSSREHILCWLMLGERRARELDLGSYDEKMFRSAVSEVRKLTNESPDIFQPRITESFAAAGVAFVLEKPISKTRLFGSARWLDDNRAIIQMSLRMKTNDHFWWTLFHECAHIVLHRGRNFADDQHATGDGLEADADRWAEDLLYGKDVLENIVAEEPRSESQVCKWAERLDLHPGILVGMLQHYRVLHHSQLNHLKLAFDWK